MPWSARVGSVLREPRRPRRARLAGSRARLRTGRHEPAGGVNGRKNTPWTFVTSRTDGTTACARDLDGAELLRYRSNLLGSDLRITNFGGGNTSAKLTVPDPLDGKDREVLWVKGSGGDLGSIERAGFATLYLDKLHALRNTLPAAPDVSEDEMVELYPLCTFGKNPVAASIDTPLHGFLPFAHVNHLHPDWGIALAAAANGRERLDELNRRFGHRLVWVPWHRPGFELAMVLRRAVNENPGCDGRRPRRPRAVHLGRDLPRLLPPLAHGHRSLRPARRGAGVGAGATAVSGARAPRPPTSTASWRRGYPAVRARSTVTEEARDRPLQRRARGAALRLLSRCRPPLRTWGRAARPLRADQDPPAVRGLGPKRAARRAATAHRRRPRRYRDSYRSYYQSFARPESPPLRDANPTVVLIPGSGDAELRQEQDRGAHHRRVLHQRHPRHGGGDGPRHRVRCRVSCRRRGWPPTPASSRSTPTTSRCRRRRRSASSTGGSRRPKLRRQPPEKELSRFVWWSSSEAAAGIGARPRSSPPSAAPTSSSPTATLEEAERTDELARQPRARRAAVAADHRHPRSRSRSGEALRDDGGGVRRHRRPGQHRGDLPLLAVGDIDDDAWATTLRHQRHAKHGSRPTAVPALKP